VDEKLKYVYRAGAHVAALIVGFRIVSNGKKIMSTRLRIDRERGLARK